MSLYTSGASPILTPDQVGELFTRPLQQESVALNNTVSTLVSTGSHSYRVPVETADATAAWTAEGAEITPSDPSVSEVTVTPSKIAGLTVLSVELASDSSNPAAADLIGRSLSNNVAKQVDTAFFGNTTTNGPSGLGSLTTATVDAGASWSNLDPFAEAISKNRALGGTVTAFVGNPDTVLALTKLKKETGSNQPLLGDDPTAPGKLQVFGVPLITSAAVEEDAVWALDSARVVAVMRDDPTVETSTDAYFSSHRMAIRVTARLAFGFPHEAALVKISLSA